MEVKAMRIMHRVRVNVTRASGVKECVLKTARLSLRSRLLTKLVGQEYAVMVLMPARINVDSVENKGMYLLSC